jgi:glycosyltransferase involved in cell wall biosynthesis
MHILLIHQAFVDLDQAGGTRHAELAYYLAARGHQVTIIASPVSYLTGRVEAKPPKGTRPQPVMPPGGSQTGRVTVLRAYSYPALHRSFAHRVLSFMSFTISSFLVGLAVRRVDLVWGTSPPLFQGATAWALRRLKRARFLFEVRDLWPAFAIQVGVLQNRLLVGLAEWLEGTLYRHADCVMVNSPGFIEHVKTHGARRVELVPNGTDPRMFDPAADGGAFRREHGLEGKFLAMYAGAHGLSNDLGVVLQAACLLKDRPEIAIALVGDGKEKPALQAEAARLGLENVTFIPPVPKEGMGEALAAADACIAILKPLPLYRTVFPNKVFDYMAAGRPVVLAIDGVIREVVEEAGGGVFIPPGDAEALAAAILRLADDPEGARRMGLDARRYVEAHFDREYLAGKLVGLLENMLESE